MYETETDLQELDLKGLQLAVASNAPVASPSKPTEHDEVVRQPVPRLACSPSALAQTHG